MSDFECIKCLGRERPIKEGIYAVCQLCGNPQFIEPLRGNLTPSPATTMEEL
jgi:hypothetical protein